MYIKKISQLEVLTYTYTYLYVWKLAYRYQIQASDWNCLCLFSFLFVLELCGSSCVYYCVCSPHVCCPYGVVVNCGFLELSLMWCRSYPDILSCLIVHILLYVIFVCPYGFRCICVIWIFSYMCLSMVYNKKYYNLILITISYYIMLPLIWNIQEHYCFCPKQDKNQTTLSSGFPLCFLSALAPALHWQFCYWNIIDILAEVSITIACGIQGIGGVGRSAAISPGIHWSFISEMDT